MEASQNNDNSSYPGPPISNATSLGAIVTVSVWILALVVVITFTSLWFRTATLQTRDLQNITEVMQRGFVNYVSMHDMFLRAAGDELLYRDVFAEPEIASAYLARVVEGQENLVGLAFLDRDGFFIASSYPETQQTPITILDNPNAAADFQHLVLYPRLSLSRPFYAPITGEWVVPIRTPIYDNQGDLQGFMSAGLRLEIEDAPWAMTSLPSGVQIGIMRRDGYLVFLFPIPEIYEYTEDAYRSRASESFREIIRRTSGVYLYARHDHTRSQEIAHYVAVNPMPELDLFVVAFRPRTELVKDFLQRLWVPFIVLLVSVFALSLSYRRARTLLRQSETEILQRQRALVTSLERYSHLMTMLPVGFYQLRVQDNGDREFIYLSQLAREIIGFDPKVPLIDGFALFMERVHPDDLERLIQMEEDAIASNSLFRWTGRFILEERIIWLNLQSRPDQHDGAQQIWHGVIIDITDQHTRERVQIPLS